MRIAIFHNRYRERGGEDTAVDGEAELLEKGGHTVVRCIADNRESLAGPLDQVRTALHARRSPSGAARAARIADEAPLDVAHVHNFFPLLSPAVHETLSARGVPVVQTLHNYRFACANGNLLRAGSVCEECIPRGPWHAVRYGCYRGSRAQTLVWADMVAHHRARETWRRCVDRFVAPTEFAARLLAKAGLPRERIEVLPLVLADPGDPAPPGHGAVYVGRLAPEKGVDLLIDAWRSVGAGWPLTIVGSGPAEAALREQARELPGVRFLGALPHGEVLRALRQAAFAVVPSRWYEVSPFAAIEALACARPVVTWRGGSVAELVGDGRAGLLFDSLDAASIARACAQLLESPDRVRELGAQAREDYLDRHAPEIGLARRERLYSAVSDERRRAGSPGADRPRA
jgi:glycosyltransferase involved in cell wall biosynthesis